MTILITGINGFIGSNLAVYFQKKNINIIGIGRKKKNYKFHYIRSDLIKLKKIPENIDTVIHLAADSPTKNNYKRLFKSNVQSCENLVRLVKNSKIKSIIYCSSFAVYENNQNKIIKENQKISKNLSIYASSKYECEKIIYKKLKNKRISITIIRLPAVLGRNCYKSSFFQLKKKILLNKKILIFNYDNYFNGIISIDRLCSFIYLILKFNKKKFQTFNLGSTNPIKFKKVIFELAKSLKKKLYYKLVNKGSSAIIDIKKAKKIGFKPNKTITVIQKFAKI